MKDFIFTQNGREYEGQYVQGAWIDDSTFVGALNENWSPAIFTYNKNENTFIEKQKLNLVSSSRSYTSISPNKKAFAIWGSASSGIRSAIYSYDENTGEWYRKNDFSPEGAVGWVSNDRVLCYDGRFYQSTSNTNTTFFTPSASLGVCIGQNQDEVWLFNSPTIRCYSATTLQTLHTFNIANFGSSRINNIHMISNYQFIVNTINYGIQLITLDWENKIATANLISSMSNNAVDIIYHTQYLHARTTQLYMTEIHGENIKTYPFIDLGRPLPIQYIALANTHGFYVVYNTGLQRHNTIFFDIDNTNTNILLKKEHIYYTFNGAEFVATDSTDVGFELQTVPTDIFVAFIDSDTEIIGKSDMCEYIQQVEEVLQLPTDAIYTAATTETELEKIQYIIIK